jgi:hypothetical protein
VPYGAALVSALAGLLDASLLRGMTRQELMNGLQRLHYAEAAIPITLCAPSGLQQGGLVHEH